MRDYLREKRRKKAEVYVPLQHYGDEDQVDFFQITSDSRGNEVTRKDGILSPSEISSWLTGRIRTFP